MQGQVCLIPCICLARPQLPARKYSMALRSVRSCRIEHTHRWSGARDRCGTVHRRVKEIEGSGRDFIDSTFNSRGNMEVTRIFAERPRVDRGITQQGKLVRQLTAPSPWRASKSPPTRNRRGRHGAIRPSKCSTGGALAFDQDVICCYDGSGCPDALIF